MCVLHPCQRTLHISAARVMGAMLTIKEARHKVCCFIDNHDWCIIPFVLHIYGVVGSTTVSVLRINATKVIGATTDYQSSSLLLTTPTSLTRQIGTTSRVLYFVDLVLLHSLFSVANGSHNDTETVDCFHSDCTRRTNNVNATIKRKLGLIKTVSSVRSLISERSVCV